MSDIGPEISTDSEEEDETLNTHHRRISSDFLLRPNYLFSAVHHYLTMDQHIIRACFNYDMELNRMSEIIFPSPERPRRYTVLQREEQLGERMAIGAALRNRGAHFAVRGRELYGSFEQAMFHFRNSDEPFYCMKLLALVTLMNSWTTTFDMWDPQNQVT